MADPRDILGRGWAFPFRVNPATGAVGMSEFEENIRQSITIILGTRPGERQMLPEFGCRIHDMLFAPSTRATSALIAHHVKDALGRWEGRIEVTDVQSEPAQDGSVKVVVQYRVRATDAQNTLSYNVASR